MLYISMLRRVRAALGSPFLISIQINTSFITYLLCSQAVLAYRRTPKEYKTAMITESTRKKKSCSTVRGGKLLQ